MSGMKLVGDWSKLENKLNRLKRISFTALHKNIGEQLLSNTKDRFRKQKGPDNRPWKKSFRSETERQGKTLMDTRRLYNSLGYKAFADRTEVGTNVKYGPIHQFGGVIRPKRNKYLKFKLGSSWRVVKKVTIPARPFLGFNNSDREDIEGIIGEEIARIMR